jgi:nanoRNase/pAp phosphatase (c-di-AMP/oligoRNAs hydrolase)
MKPDGSEAKALFLGIAFDTRHFVLANSTTLKNIAELVDVGVNAQETLSLLSLPMAFSERVARLKASRRTKLFRIGEWIVALSHVSAYQASAARAMIELGAHVAAVAGEKNGALEISLRGSLEFHKRTGIDVAKPLGEYLHGMGGGHATAAGVNGEGDIEVGLRRCLWLLKERLANHN